MKVLKFTLDQELPDTVYVEETMGMGDALSYEYIGYEEIAEALRLGDLYAPITEESVAETVGLDDGHTIVLSEDILESLGLSDTLYQYDPGSTTFYKALNFHLGMIHSTSDYLYNMIGTGRYFSTTAVNAFQFLMSTGNITGTVRVYGVRK